MFGISRSISTTSGVSSAAFCQAITPSGASPTTSMSGCSSRKPRRPRRTTSWSSTSMTRMRSVSSVTPERIAARAGPGSQARALMRRMTYVAPGPSADVSAPSRARHSLATRRRRRTDWRERVRKEVEGASDWALPERSRTVSAAAASIRQQAGTAASATTVGLHRSAGHAVDGNRVGAVPAAAAQLPALKPRRPEGGGHRASTSLFMPAIVSA